jgi:folate-binding protein YgfZ
MTATDTVEQELETLRTGAGFSPVTDRAFLHISGPDATRWLNGMVTNSIQALQSGEGNYNFLLNAQGRIQGDCTIFREPSEGEPTFLLETDSSQLETIQQTLDRFIIMDDVELVPLTDLSGILIAGGKALSLVMALGTQNGQAATCATDMQAVAPQTVNLKQTLYGSSPVSIIQAYSPLVPRFEIWSDPATTASILTELKSSSAVRLSADDLEALRILEARPNYGIDIRNNEAHKDLPQETAQTHALHFAKGCYLGQEIVERIRSRGQIHRTFAAFTLIGDLPSLPAPLEANGKAAGELTSAIRIGNHIHALGYVRREFLETGAPITYAGGSACPKLPR